MARAEERREGEGKGRDELEHLEPILGFRFEMTEGLEWLGKGFKFWTFWSISFRNHRNQCDNECWNPVRKNKEKKRGQKSTM